MPLMRGAIPTPRHKLAAAVPFVPVVAPPTSYLWLPVTLEMWGNNEYGDCVTAEEAFAKACYSPEILISNQEAITWASQHGVLNGAVLSDVLEMMESSGFQQSGYIYDDGTHNSVDWTDAGTLEAAIAQGPVKLGVAADQLEKAYTGKNGWFATGFTTDTNEDHCTSACGYGSIQWLAQQLGVTVPTTIDGTAPGYGLFTWSTVGIIDVPSMLAITSEAWLRTPTTIITQVGPQPRPRPRPQPRPRT